jgi:uncharacterized membrane protein YkoI
MKRRTKIVAGGSLAAGLVIAAAGLAMATGNDTDTPLAGSDLDHATRSALEHTGGGTVLETEQGDGGAAYSVEIRLDDGAVVEVSLDHDFAVIGQESDEDAAGGSEGAEGATDD